jgi:hypothetical protein
MKPLGMTSAALAGAILGLSLLVGRQEAHASPDPWIEPIVDPMIEEMNEGYAASGDRGGNGGDPVIERIQRLRKLFEPDPVTGKTPLRELLYLLITNNPRWSLIRDPYARAMLEDMTIRGLRESVTASLYDLKGVNPALQGDEEQQAACEKYQDQRHCPNQCINEEGHAVAATTYSGDVWGTLCFDLRRLAETGASEAEIIALALHEHAHLFGYKDKKMAINGAVREMLEDRASSYTIPKEPPQPPKKLPPLPKLFVETPAAKAFAKCETHGSIGGAGAFACSRCCSKFFGIEFCANQGKPICTRTRWPQRRDFF